MTADSVDMGLTWINPLGGLGDTLLLSGVLKQVVDLDPGRRFNLVIRTKYPPLLQGHPALEMIGHPQPGARIIGADYWSEPGFGDSGMRAYQALAQRFGLQTPVPETLYTPWEMEDDPLLEEFLPRGRFNILLSPSSSAPRKQPATARWGGLVRQLKARGAEVVQVGHATDDYIRGAVSLLGLTSSRQVISLMRRFDLLLGVDNFLMHAARLTATPAVILWGPTDHRVYGYPDQSHLQATPPERCAGKCLGPGRGELYPTPCPEGDGHCLNQLDDRTILDAVEAVIDEQMRENF